MEKEVGKINKNDTTDIVVRVDDFGGRRGLTIREFVTSDRYTGFTKSGVRILAENFPKFKEMVNSVSNEEMAEPVENSGVENAKPEQKRSSKKVKETSINEEPEEKISVEKPGWENEELPDY